MITPQDIREKTFEKAVFGGYDMTSVDSFLEELANDLTLLQKENKVLKGKMKVLVDKVEEYRGNEDALRTAVLSAQKLGLMIEKEARDKAQTIVSEANAEAERITRDANAQLELENARLTESRNASAKFLDSMDLLCRRQLEFLQKVGEMDFVKSMRSDTPAPARESEPAPAEVHETVSSIEETVTKVLDTPAAPPAARPVEDDERPTRPFNVITDAEDSLEHTTQFSLEDFRR